jgi:thiamine pyrophosphate-dependent acetolactate synthase large subunit-like protein
LAEAFGVKAERIDGLDELEAALERAFAARHPYLIEMVEPKQL